MSERWQLLRQINARFLRGRKVNFAMPGIGGGFTSQNDVRNVHKRHLMVSPQRHA
jgi:hypothetical protein